MGWFFFFISFLQNFELTAMKPKYFGPKSYIIPYFYLIVDKGFYQQPVEISVLFHSCFSYENAVYIHEANMDIIQVVIHISIVTCQTDVDQGFGNILFVDIYDNQVWQRGKRCQAYLSVGPEQQGNLSCIHRFHYQIQNHTLLYYTTCRIGVGWFYLQKMKARNHGRK